MDPEDEILGTPTTLKAPSSAKMVNDPVHGHFTLPNYVVKVVDTPQFQRLRDLKQLGASHNRFEHCLGVSHLAGKLLRCIDKNQPELDIDNRDLQLVSIAGLCHGKLFPCNQLMVQDLGHGPFSHAFEEWIHRVKPEAKWHHEEMSKRMLDHLIDDNNIDMDRHDINFVKELIGGHPGNGSREKRFLFDIVANMRNSVDVDKFDYLARDCLNLGIKSSYDYSRLLKFARVIDNEICFHSKEVYNVYEMFHTRYSMHKQVYTHRVGKAIEYMISDAMALADPFMNISNAINDPEEYTLLTDSILHSIESSKQQELAPARAIIKNIRQRKLYKFADEVLVPPEKWDILLKIKESDIVNISKELKPDDIIINVVSMNYAMKERNPVDSVKFYTKWDDNESFTIPKENVSLLIPDQFSEKYIRIFTRDPTKARIAQSAFRTYLSQFHFKPSPAHSLPSNSSQAAYVPPSSQLESVRKKLRLSFG